MDKNLYAVIMAGGRGERFWPQSRASHPKQLLRLMGNLTLIEQTVGRLDDLVASDNTIIITNDDYVAPMKSLLPQIPPENIIGEPIGRDTAPCVALASSVVKAKAEDPEQAVMMMLPSDHVINQRDALVSSLSESAELAREKNVVTIGVTPGFASTGYGYIHCGEKIETDTDTKFYKSLGFKEKPDTGTAEKFIQDGSYKWNSGMFLWTVDTIDKAFCKHAPELSEKISVMEKAFKKGNLKEILNEVYPDLKKESIDYAVMEKIQNVVVADCSFDWDDVGSWSALKNQLMPQENNNIIQGLHVGLDTENSIIVGESNHLIATADVKDMIIVHTEDATLVCDGKSSQRVKELVKIIADHDELSGYL